MRIKPLSLASLLIVLHAADICAGQRSVLGSEPANTFAARNIFEEYNLPPLPDRSTDPLRQAEQHTQVLTRDQSLSWDERAATATWMKAAGIYAEGVRYAKESTSAGSTPFTGTTASQLNAVLALPATRFVKVTAPMIRVDVPILINREEVDIDFGDTRLVAETTQPFLLRIERAKNVRLHGGVFTGQGWAVLVNRSQNVAISNTTVQQATGGVMVTNSHDLVILENEFHALREAPILLHGNTHRVLILQNQITGNLGNSNWHAGIVISDRNADVSANPRSMMHGDNYGAKEQQITSRLAIPTDNLIAFNIISGNYSSGIYSDGGSENVFAQNSIEGNSKEGFCLDNGSSANVVVFNVIRSNGKRWGKTDADLQHDFVQNLGRLPDGSSPAKLPGISLDNAAFNQILFNSVHDNYGGGIKMVRTAFYNVVGMNTLNENNEGRSEVFHFFGIELGAAAPDVKVPDLDFRPSRGNMIFGNAIRGKHYAGIFFASGSDTNDIFDNSIFGATDWALESVEPLHNSSFNNLSNLRSRNISTGLDPNLLVIGSGH